MTYTISDLWNGNIAPCEHCGAHDERANQLYCTMQQQKAQLCDCMSPAQNLVFQEYLDYAEEYLLRMMELAFCDGFCIASDLVREASF